VFKKLTLTNWVIIVLIVTVVKHYIYLLMNLNLMEWASPQAIILDVILFGVLFFIAATGFEKLKDKRSRMSEER